MGFGPWGYQFGALASFFFLVGGSAPSSWPPVWGASYTGEEDWKLSHFFFLKKKGELESWIFKTAVISLHSFFPYLVDGLAEQEHDLCDPSQQSKLVDKGTVSMLKIAYFLSMSNILGRKISLKIASHNSDFISDHRDGYRYFFQSSGTSYICAIMFCFTQQLFSCSVMSDCLRAHGQQHARLPCPSPSPGGEMVKDTFSQTHIH